MRAGQAGVTLIERLVVLSIIAIASGAVMLRFVGQSGTDAVAEAGRLADAMTVASEAALVSGNPQAVVWSAHGWRLMGWQSGRDWQTLSQHDLGAGLTLTRLDGQNGPVIMAPGGVAQPASFALTLPDHRSEVRFDGLAAREIGAS